MAVAAINQMNQINMNHPPDRHLALPDHSRHEP